jgi:flavin-dependent dehydrogenase
VSDNGSSKTYDAVVIGGGPAGCAASTCLALKGRRVVMLEKEQFPRYHIGESLIPYTYFPLSRMGMLDKMKSSHFTRKYSVQFVSRDGRASHPFYFFQHLAHEAARTWQVLRSEFDQLLMDNAREKGVEVIEQITARELIEENGVVKGVRAVAASGENREFYAPMTVDASGREALTITRRGWKVRDPVLNKIAVWTYYKGAKRDPGLDEGATTVAYVPEKGWFWYIPQAGDNVSVGVVAEKDYLYSDSRDPKEIFHREVGRNKWIEEHLAVGQQYGPYRTTGEYSYRSKYCAADGVILAGDAFAFLDPVFSSGVLIALRSGEMAADEVDRALTDGDVSAERFRQYGDDLCNGIESMRRLVYAFYDHAFSFRKLLDRYPKMKDDTTDCLTGDLFRNFDELYAAVSDFAKVPDPLEHGRPYVPEVAAETSLVVA